MRQLERADRRGRAQGGAQDRGAARRVDATSIDADDVRELLGRPRVHPETRAGADEVGVATGMYYTPMGGDIMFVEASIRRLTAVARRTATQVGRAATCR